MIVRKLTKPSDLVNAPSKLIWLASIPTFFVPVGILFEDSKITFVRLIELAPPNIFVDPELFELPAFLDVKFADLADFI